MYASCGISDPAGGDDGCRPCCTGFGRSGTGPRSSPRRTRGRAVMASAAVESSPTTNHDGGKGEDRQGDGGSSDTAHMRLLGGVRRARCVHYGGDRNFAQILLSKGTAARLRQTEPCRAQQVSRWVRAASTPLIRSKLGYAAGETDCPGASPCLGWELIERPNRRLVRLGMSHRLRSVFLGTTALWPKESRCGAACHGRLPFLNRD